MAEDAELDLVRLLVPFVVEIIFYCLSMNCKESCSII